MAWPLVGRDRELALAGELLSDALTGGVVVVGAPGVGKTRLAAEVSRVAASRDCAVEWVRATRSAATIPLGAFAALVPAPPDSASEGGAELLSRARQALAERSGGRRLVLCVDDGQLLDDASAALLHQLVAAREAFAVVTVRRGERAPDALRALWKDDLCSRLELGALARDELERLLVAALGGPVDGPSGHALWELTRGNALFARELVRYGIERGALSEQGGIWSWRGDMAAGMRLSELVEARLEALEAAGRSVLELVAIGAPLEMGVLEPGELVALSALELHEVVERRVDGRRRSIDVVHPLHGEVIRAGLTPTRLEAIQRRLAEAVEARGGRRREDLLRLAVWRLDSGEAGDSGLLERAAGQALAALDLVLAERLGRAAVQAGGGFGARLVLGRALAGAGRAEEAHTLLGDLEPQAAGDAERAEVAIAIARNAFWGLDRAADADAVLRRAERTVSDDGLRAELAAQRVRLEAAHGRPDEALAAALPLLEDASVREQARLPAVLAAAEALLSCGRTDEAVALTQAWEPAARRHGEALPVFESVLLSMRGLALRLAGRLVEATETSQAVYALALTRRSAQTAAVEAASLGFIWLARGNVRTALRHFRESAALLRDADPSGMLAWALAGLTQAAAQAGESELARQTVAELERTPLGHKGFEFELGLARAWSAAAAGEHSRARALAHDTSELTQSRGQDGYTMRALHELCRLGDAAGGAPRLARVATQVDGSFAANAAAHAQAVVARDGPALLDVAERFATEGALLVGAEAADAAAAAFRDAGREASARAAAARAAVLLDACEGARPPTLVGGQAFEELTRREREIAVLAASGLSSRQIAERLVVSVRTVDNHLQRAYRKLGVTRRQDLAQVLGGAPE